MTQQVIVRLTTTAWADHAGLYLKRHLRFQKKLSDAELCPVLEDSEQISALAAINAVKNFNCVPDGLYKLVVIDKVYAQDTGLLDSQVYELRPYSGQQ